MTGREIVDYVLDKRGLVVTMGHSCAPSFDEQFRNDWSNIIEMEIHKRMKGLLDEVDCMRAMCHDALMLFQQLESSYIARMWMDDSPSEEDIDLMRARLISVPLPPEVLLNANQEAMHVDSAKRCPVYPIRRRHG